MLRKHICLHCLAARCSAPVLSLHTSGGVAWISLLHPGSQNGGERALPRHSSEGKAAPGAACGNTGPLFTFSFPPLWWKITLCPGPMLWAWERTGRWLPFPAHSQLAVAMAPVCFHFLQAQPKRKAQASSCLLVCELQDSPGRAHLHPKQVWA